MEKKNKKPFIKRNIWPLIVVLILVFWPAGLVLAFIKLTDQRNDKEDSVPFEDYLSYSESKTEDENLNSVNKEKSVLRAIKVSKLVIIILITVGGLGLVREIRNCIVFGFTRGFVTDLMRDFAILLLGFLVIYYSNNITVKRRRFVNYMSKIKSENTVSYKDLAETFDYEESLVIEDIRQMHQDGYFIPSTVVNDDGIIYRHS